MDIEIIPSEECPKDRIYILSPVMIEWFQEVWFALATKQDIDWSKCPKNTVGVIKQKG